MAYNSLTYGYLLNTFPKQKLVLEEEMEWELPNADADLSDMRTSNAEWRRVIGNITQVKEKLNGIKFMGKSLQRCYHFSLYTLPLPCLSSATFSGFCLLYAD